MDIDWYVFKVKFILDVSNESDESDELNQTATLLLRVKEMIDAVAIFSLLDLIFTRFSLPEKCLVF